MTSQTPPPADADGELREKIFKDISPHSYGFMGAKSYSPENVDYIFALVQTETANAVLAAEAQGEYNLIRRIEKLTSKMDDDYGEFECLEDIENLLRERAPIVEAALKQGPTNAK